MATEGTCTAVFLDGMGTLIGLVPPAPALARALGVDVQTAERAFRAEAAYYVEHHLDGGDEAGLARLRERCARVLAEAAGVPPDGALDALLGRIAFEAFDAVAPALCGLRARGLRLVVVSNWDCSLVSVLERVGLADLVDGVLASAVVGAAKPDPAIFASACELA